MRDSQTASRDELITTLSHELRTPLATVHGAALTVRFRKDELSEEREAELLDLIAEESARLGRIVENIVLASHLGSGEVRAYVEPCDARDLACAVVERERRRGAEIDLVAPPCLPDVLVDRELFQQVLASLVDNALKYSAGKPSVEIRLERHGAKLHVAVTDDGPGIPPDETERVFEKFSRLDPEQTRGIGGMGLGLYIGRELVERMGGRLRVLAEHGDGSTFVVELPLAPAQREACRRRWPSRRRRRRRTAAIATGA
jgi:two-component system sensor histidine kinase KdpD